MLILRTLLEFIMAHAQDILVGSITVMFSFFSSFMIWTKARPPLFWLVSTTLANAIQTVVYLLLGLHWAAAWAAVNATIWGIVAVQEFLHPSPKALTRKERAELRALRKERDELTQQLGGLQP
jgi:hypothetical protein